MEYEIKICPFCREKMVAQTNFQLIKQPEIKPGERYSEVLDPIGECLVYLCKKCGFVALFKR